MRSTGICARAGNSIWRQEKQNAILLGYYGHGPDLTFGKSYRFSEDIPGIENTHDDAVTRICLFSESDFTTGNDANALERLTGGNDNFPLLAFPYSRIQAIKHNIRDLLSIPLNKTDNFKVSIHS